MSLLVLLDEDVPRRVAPGLRERGVDAVSIHEIGRGNRSIADEAQLQFAAEQGRVIVTYNRRDFQALDARWRAEGRVHAGIFWCLEQTIARTDIGGLIRALQAASEEFDSLEGLCLILQSRREQE